MLNVAKYVVGPSFGQTEMNFLCLQSYGPLVNRMEYQVLRTASAQEQENSMTLNATTDFIELFVNCKFIVIDYPHVTSAHSFA